MIWRINRIQYPLFNLGEGKRIGIWVQGCNLRCKGCISPSLWTDTGGKEISVEYLVSEIGRLPSDYSGVTLTGGEPFRQYASLIFFCACLKKMTPLNIFVYTGYYLEELYKLFPDRLFLKYIDLVMDGRYVKKKHENRRIRGSTNQTLYRFTGQEAVRQDKFFAPGPIGLRVMEDGRVFLSGIPGKNELDELSGKIEKSGNSLFFR